MDYSDVQVLVNYYLRQSVNHKGEKRVWGGEKEVFFPSSQVGFRLNGFKVSVVNGMKYPPFPLSYFVKIRTLPVRSPVF